MVMAPPEEERELLRRLRASVIAQLRAQAQQMPDVPLFSTAAGPSSRSFSPTQLLEEIERDTQLGRDLLLSAMALSTTRNLLCTDGLLRARAASKKGSSP
jgi:hypothetical protein